MNNLIFLFVYTSNSYNILYEKMLVSGGLSSELYNQIQTINDDETSAEILKKWRDTYIYRKYLYKTAGQNSVLKKHLILNLN